MLNLRIAGSPASAGRVATGPLLRFLPEKLATTMLTWIGRGRRRRALRDLAARVNDPHLLRDIGVSPDDVAIEREKWFWQR
jgi:uncharacterized protein YjiS (DUF1127 family)